MIIETPAAPRASGRYLADMEIRILGPIEVAVDGRAINPGGPRERALLALLALTPGQVISSDRLIDDLWGEEGERLAGQAREAFMGGVGDAVLTASILLVVTAVAVAIVAPRATRGASQD